MTHFVTLWRGRGARPQPLFRLRLVRDALSGRAAFGVASAAALHRVGATELRNPHPRFDAAWYVDQHPEAAGNPLLYHLLFGARARLADRAADRHPRLPAHGAAPPSPPRGVVVDVVIPVIAAWRRRSAA